MSHDIGDSSSRRPQSSGMRQRSGHDGRWAADAAAVEAPSGGLGVRCVCRDQPAASSATETGPRRRPGGVAAALPATGPSPSRTPVEVDGRDSADRSARGRTGATTVAGRSSSGCCDAVSQPRRSRRSTGSLNRRGLVVPSPAERPQGPTTRFEYSERNACWQMDGTEWTLADGTKVTIISVLDDHTRRALDHAAPSENATTCGRVLQGAEHLRAPGASPDRQRGRVQRVPPRLGRGPDGEPASPGRAARSARSNGHPQTCGKDERSHRTLQRWLQRPALRPGAPGPARRLDRDSTTARTRARTAQTTHERWASAPDPVRGPRIPAAPPLRITTVKVSAAGGLRRQGRHRPDRQALLRGDRHRDPPRARDHRSSAARRSSPPSPSTAPAATSPPQDRAADAVTHRSTDQSNTTPTVTDVLSITFRSGKRLIDQVRAGSAARGGHECVAVVDRGAVATAGRAQGALGGVDRAASRRA